jgi:hypothetical protein
MSNYKLFSPSDRGTSPRMHFARTLQFLFAFVFLFPQLRMAPVSTSARDASAPGAPAGLAAVAGDAVVDLIWTASSESGLAGYNVYRSQTSPVLLTRPINGSTPVSFLSYHDPGLKNYIRYYYAVTAVTASGKESAASNEAAAMPVAAPVQGALSYNEVTPVPDSELSAVDAAGPVTSLSTAGALASAPNQPVVVLPSDGASGVVSPATLTVQVSDPDSSALTVTFYGRPKISLPAADFTVVHVPDSQSYTLGSAGAALFNGEIQWISDHQTSNNVAFVTHSGDITENGNNDTDNSEWNIASGAMGRLERGTPSDGADDVPFGVAPGNHDALGGWTRYESTFGVALFDGRAYYGGHYGSDNTNNFSVFSASGMHFVSIQLACVGSDPTTAVLNWADALLKADASRRGIVVCHEAMTGNSLTTSGAAIYNALRDNPNFFLILAGHDGIGRTSGSGTDGHAIYSLMADYEGSTEGWIRLMEFQPADNQISVTTYSPTSNGGAGAYRTGTDDQFTLPLTGMQSPDFTLLGTVTNVASGSNASVSWPGLTSGTQYEWYAVASDGTSSSASSTSSFSTGKGTPTLSVTNPSVTYNGTPQAAEITGSVEGLVSNIKYKGSSVIPTNAGTYVVTADFTPTDLEQYNSLMDAPAGNFTINKATPTLSVANSPVTYNGSPQPATFTRSVPGSVSDVKYSGSSIVPSNANTYVVTADFAPSDSTNYNTLNNATAGNFLINKANQTISFGVLPAKVYGDPDFGVSATASSGLVVSFSASGNCSVSTNIVHIAGAGTCAVVAHQAGNNNYNAAADVTQSFGIAKATPTLSVTSPSVTYNGSPQAANVTGSAAGAVSNVKYAGSSTVPTNAAIYAVTANFAPTDASNYNSLTNASAGSFTISKATPTLSVTNSPVVSNGLPQAAIVTGSVAGAVSNIQYNGSATVPTSAGTYRVTADLAPTDSINYNALTNALAGNFVINDATPAALHLSPQNIYEAQPSGTIIGTFATDDPDTGDTFTYSLVTTGCAGTDNTFFNVSGNNLVSKAVFDYEARNAYQICAQTDDGHGHQLQQAFTITILNLPGATLSLPSVATADGWILESAAGSGTGGTINNGATTFQLGDDAKNRQYRSILSFNTAALPDNAILTSVTLRIRRQSISGSDPFGSMGNILIDIQKPFFGTALGLQSTDFQAASNPLNPVATMLEPGGAVNGSWYSVTLDSSAFSSINVAGTTQLRLRFASSSNNNQLANLLKFSSGNAAAASKPVLVVEYAVPSAALSVQSVAASDGWILESAAGSGNGGTVNNGATTFQLGDDPKNRQYRSVLSFNTAALPDNAKLSSVMLQIRRQSVSGSDPFGSMGEILVDVKKPFFGNNVALQTLDFNAPVDYSNAAIIPNTPNGSGWYSVTLPASAFETVNLSGTTQFRLRFANSSNHNKLADLLKFYSGNAGTASSRPILTVAYSLP